MVNVEHKSSRLQEIGQAQAWYYPADQLLVLWECYLFEGYRVERAEEDQVLLMVWQGFERFLAERLPEAKRIVTPAWEDPYERKGWQAFLLAQGYQQSTQQAMVKTL